MTANHYTGIVYLPFVQGPFHTTALGGGEWLKITVLALPVFQRGCYDAFHLRRNHARRFSLDNGRRTGQGVGDARVRPRPGHVLW